MTHRPPFRPTNKATPKGRDWWTFEALADKNGADIAIMDTIGAWGVAAAPLVEAIGQLEPESTINLHICSPGGDVFEGNEIFNALNAHKGQINVTIGALCASIATMIACVGDTVTMAKNGLYMIHNVSGYTYGDAKAHRRNADVIDKLSKGIIDVYAGKSHQPPDVLETMMAEETWMTSEEAVDKGFVDSGDEDEDDAEVVNRFELGQFRNCAAAIAKLSKLTRKPAPPAPAPRPQASRIPARWNPNQSTLANDYRAGKLRIFATK